LSFGGGGGTGEIRYVVVVDNSQAISNLQSTSQELQTLGQNSETTSQQVSKVSPALDDVKTSSDQVRQSSQQVGPSIAQVGTAIAFAASSVISLVQQYTSLKRAQNTLKKAQDTEQGQVTRLKDLWDKYTKAVDEHGKNSTEAKRALEKYNNLQEKHQHQLEKIDLMQESLSQRMMSFAVSVVPTTIGVVSGLAQTFQILGTGRGGAGGMKGVLGLITRFGPPLLILGGFLLAVKFNLFGVRDALDGFGKVLGDAIPALKPVLNALRDLGVVIGLIPGNAEDAQKRLKSFAGGVIAWSKDVASAIGKIFDKLKSGDIKGALEDIKAGLKTAFDITVGSILFDGKPLSKWIDQLITFFQVDMKQHGAWTATVDTLNIIFKTFIWPSIVPEAQRAIKKMQADIQSVFNNPAGAGLGGIVLDISNFITMAKKGDTSNEKFESWLSTQIGLFKVTLKQKFIEFKNWALSTPLLGDVIRALFPGQKGSTLGGLDISGAIFTFLDNKVVKPLQQGWATAVDTVYKFITQNPLGKIFTVDNIMGTISNILGGIKKWLTDNIGSPVKKAWDDFVAGIVSYIKGQTASGDTGFSGFPDGGFDFGESKKPPSRSRYYTQSFGDLSIGNGPVCFDDSGRQRACSTRDDNANAGMNSGLLQGKTDFRNLLMGMGGANMFDTLARQIVQITNNLNVFAKVIVQVTKDISVYAKAVVTTVSDHNTFAKTIVTIIKDINTYAKTLVTLTKDISVYAKAVVTTIKDHNQLAKTIVTITKDNNQLAKTIVQITKNNNTYAKTIVTVTKDINQAARATVQWEKDNKKLASSLNNVASAAKKAASAIRNVPSGGGSGGFNFGSAQGGLHTTLGSDTMILAHAGERVDIGHGSNQGGVQGTVNQTINLMISGNDLINERNLTKRIKLTVGENRDKFG